jgi:hypothetical protein
VAIDGKKLRGSRTDELPAVYLLSALARRQYDVGMDLTAIQQNLCYFKTLVPKQH